MTMTPTHKALTPAGEWVEGWFDYSYNDHPVIWFKQPSEEGSFVAVFPSTVCRATGLTDKNGNVIYEGDESTIGDQDEILTISYEEACFIIKYEKGWFHLYEVYKDITLTGKNIHDKTSAE